MDPVLAANLITFNPWLAPVFIFFARIVDVSIGTLRIMLVARGMRLIASLLGFFEVLIWLLAISQIIQSLTSWQNYIAYAAGFASGTYIGMTIEHRLSLGTQLVRIIVPRNGTNLSSILIDQGYRVTHVDGNGAVGPVSVIFTIVRRSSLSVLLNLIRSQSPEAFYSVEDVAMARQADPALAAGPRMKDLLQPFYWFRKSK